MNPKVIYADLDPREGVVLNLETKNYYKLNETAQIVWKRVADGLPAETIAKEIAEQYDVTEEEALRDVADLIAQLKREDLVTVT